MPERYLPAPANILLVDDRKENLAVLKHYLESPEVRLVTATSGDQALREVLHQDFALILLDVVMPDMTGFEVANHLKAVERTRHIPIIFLTAYAADVAQIFEAYSVGAVDYLVKPVDRVVVRKKVEVFVDLHRQRRELLYQEALLRAAERREHELEVAELRVASDRRYRALVQGIEHAIAWTAVPAGDGWRLTFVSDQAERLLQYRAEQLARPGFMVDRVHPAERAQWLKTLEDARAGHSDESCVHRFIAADGREVWFRTVVSGHVADPEHPAEVHGLSLDVTELKHGELTQRFLADAAAVLAEPRDFHAALEELARFVVPGLADGCVVEVVHEEALQQLAVVHVNPAAEARARELGMERDPSSISGAGEVLRTGRAVLHAEPPPEPGLPPAPLGPAYARVLRALNAHSFLSLPLRPRGELRAVITLVASSPARRFGPAVMALAEDLVTRSALIVDNARLYDEARQATRARDELLAVVSHDLKNPLSAIALGARRIETLDPALPSSQTLVSARTAASRIHRAASRMERLLNDLLDMERIQTQRLRLEPQPQDAADLMNEAGELLAPVAATRSIALQLENEAPRALRIPADSERLLQVFWNLVGNAIKFTPEGGTIVVRLQAEESWARFTVTDSGPGLKGDQLQRVFEPRWQAEGGGARQGLGLGLAIAKGIVEAHGGRIWAENVPDHGACFGILLPTVADEDCQVGTTH